MLRKLLEGSYVTELKIPAVPGTTPDPRGAPEPSSPARHCGGRAEAGRCGRRRSFPAAAGS